MTDANSTYATAAADLDNHVRTCPSCSIGVACPTGDDTAEREFRAWRQLQRDRRSGGDR